MISKDLLKQEAQKRNIALNDIALDRFDKYAELLVKWNKKINLTAITDPNEIVYKHFLDSLMLLNFVDIPSGSNLIDVGTGAGFPGVAILCARPDLAVTLLDSTKKKLNVIDNILNELGLTANLVHMRAEDAGKSAEFREQYKFVTARAVTNLRDLCEYCIPFVCPKGYFVPLKGADAANELKEAQNAISILGGKFVSIDNYKLPECGDRAIIHIEKISQTSAKYPRPSAQIAKKPLI